MDELKERTRDSLLGIQHELEEIYETENGCNTNELVLLLRVIQMIDSTCDCLGGVVDTAGKKRKNLPVINVPLHLPYKKARMQIMRLFQAAYCSHMMLMHGTTNAAAKAAKMDQGNFRRILRTAIEETA